MRLRLFTVASSISLLLCAATVLVWAWSYSSRSAISQYHRTYSAGKYALGTGPGKIFVCVQPYPRSFVIATTIGGRRVPVSGPVPLIGNSFLAVQSDSRFVPGASWSEDFVSIPMTAGPPMRQLIFREVGVSFWLPCVLLSVAPVLWLTRRLRAGNPLAGRCVRCGYDLRATPDRCPECGAVPRNAEASA